MKNPPDIDPSRHPLALGFAPLWADEWGQDEYGVFAGFSVGAARQRLRWIPPGRFWMGSPEGEPGRFSDEGPRHEVYITAGFWLFDTPCTQALWQAVMGDNPSYFKSPRRPVERVSWDDVQIFLSQISAKVPGLTLTLPSEAQWEYACRAGTDTALYNGPIAILGYRNAPALDEIAWYGGNSGKDFDLPEGHDSSGWDQMQYRNPKSGPREVGQKQPNAFGLHDMLGNAWEWCADGRRDYTEATQFDPLGPQAAGAASVLRGGSWCNGARDCRSAFRIIFAPDLRDVTLGFRCALVQA